MGEKEKLERLEKGNSELRSKVDKLERELYLLRSEIDSKISRCESRLEMRIAGMSGNINPMTFAVAFYAFSLVLLFVVVIAKLAGK